MVSDGVGGYGSRGEGAGSTAGGACSGEELDGVLLICEG